MIGGRTVDVVDFARITAVLRGQYVLGHELVQTLQVGVHVDSLADLLLKEGLHPANYGVDERGDVDHVHLLEFDRIGLLDADQELLDKGRGDFGEVVGGGDAGVQDVHVAGDSDLFFGESHVTHHEHQFHDVGQVGGVHVFVVAPHYYHPSAVRCQAGKWRESSENRHKYFI